MVFKIKGKLLLGRVHLPEAALTPSCVPCWLLLLPRVQLIRFLLLLHPLRSLENGLVQCQVLVPVLGEAGHIVHLLDQLELDGVVDHDLSRHDHSQVHHSNESRLLEHVDLREDLEALLHEVGIGAHLARDQPDELLELELAADLEPVLVAL